MTRPLHILVVDDDEDNAQSLGELFELEGHRATVVHSGHAAVEAFRHTAFDIAFMDVMMPGKNGVDSFLEIRNLRPDAKVYMMTGYSVEQLLRQAMENGAMGVMSKPLDPRKVLNTLAEIGENGIVVLADDDPDSGQQLERMIEGAGRPCQLVRNRHEIPSEEQIAVANLLIFDLKSTLLQGFEVYAALRKQGRVVPAIIITASGHQYDDTVAAMRDVAVTGILTKPFDPLVLLGQLEQLAA
jgi:CheY-like chemotaxis protein